MLCAFLKICKSQGSSVVNRFFPSTGGENENTHRLYIDRMPDPHSASMTFCALGGSTSPMRREFYSGESRVIMNTLLIDRTNFKPSNPLILAQDAGDITDHILDKHRIVV